MSINLTLIDKNPGSLAAYRDFVLVLETKI